LYYGADGYVFIEGYAVYYYGFYGDVGSQGTDAGYNSY